MKRLEVKRRVQERLERVKITRLGFRRYRFSKRTFKKVLKIFSN